MNPRKLRLGFILAAAGMLCALILPLSSEAVAALSARPALLALTLLAVLLFAVAASIGGILAVASGLSGAVVGAVVTLALLRDPAIAGSAAASAPAARRSRAPALPRDRTPPPRTAAESKD